MTRNYLPAAAALLTMLGTSRSHEGFGSEFRKRNRARKRERRNQLARRSRATNRRGSR